MPMSNEKLRQVLDELEEILLPPRMRRWMTEEEVHHLRSMIDRARPMVDKPEKREKLMRWIGFMQGALWSSEAVSLEALKRMNKPDEATYDEQRDR